MISRRFPHYRRCLSAALLAAALSMFFSTTSVAEDGSSAVDPERWWMEPIISPRVGTTWLSDSTLYDAHPSRNPRRETIGVAISGDVVQGSRQNRYFRFSLFHDLSTDDVLDHSTTGVSAAHGWRRFKRGDPWRYQALQLGVGVGVLNADNDQDTATHGMLELQFTYELGLRRATLAADVFVRQHSAEDFNGDELAPFTYGLRFTVGFRVGRRALPMP